MCTALFRTVPSVNDARREPGDSKRKGIRDSNDESDFSYGIRDVESIKRGKSSPLDNLDMTRRVSLNQSAEHGLILIFLEYGKVGECRIHKVIVPSHMKCSAGGLAKSFGDNLEIINM